jgi:hypothetical protein
MNGETHDLSLLSLDELVTLKVQIARDRDAIDSQLDEAKAKAAATGEYAPLDWFHRAKSARQFKTRDYQLVEAEIAKRNRKAKESKKDLIRGYFIEVAREQLDKDTFDLYLEEARFRADV